jgi:hypothetical protein
VCSERRKVLTDPKERLANGSGHTGASAFRRRSGSSILTTQPDGAGQLADEEVAFDIRLVGAAGVPEAPCFFDVFFDFRKASTVGILRLRVEVGPASPSPKDEGPKSRAATSTTPTPASPATRSTRGTPLRLGEESQRTAYP